VRFSRQSAAPGGVEDIDTRRTAPNLRETAPLDAAEGTFENTTPTDNK
jgi:hypothetical protein